MRCFNCGTSLADADRFCPNCGVDTVNLKKESSELVLCPTCGDSFPLSQLDRNGYSAECPVCRRRKEKLRAEEEARQASKKEKFQESERADYRSQRRAERFSIAGCYVRIHLVGLTARLFRKDSQRMAPLIDLSVTGLQCEVGESFSKGDPVGIDLLVPAFTTPLRLRGFVRWIELLGEERSRIGLQFDDTDEKTLAHLRALEKHQSLRDAVYLREKKNTSTEMKAVVPPEKERPADF